MTTSPYPVEQKLVVTPPRLSDESLLGYMMRLTEANGYLSQKAIIRLLEQHSGKSLRAASDVVSDIAALEALEGYVDAPPSSLTPWAWRAMESASGPYFNIRGAPIPMDALMTEHAQVCPACLAEGGYVKEDWELSGVTVCSKHAIALVDRCPGCHRFLAVLRIPLATCSHCQFDLRQASTIGAAPTEIVLAEYLAALAPYRLKHRDQIFVDYPESLFALGQTLSFSTRDVLGGHWAERHFQHLSVDDRRAALQPMASAFNGPAIDALQLHRSLLTHVAHRLPYLPRHLALEPLVEFLQASQFLSPEARTLLSYGDNLPCNTSAAEHFNLHPPQFYKELDVIAFLGCSDQAWDWLVTTGHIHAPGNGYGFDADEILAARSRLAEIVSLEDIDRRFGVADLARCLVDWHIVPTATGARDLWAAIDLAVLGKVLDSLRLRSITDSTIESQRWIRVRDTQLAQVSPAEAYATFIARALRADIAGLRWKTPYSLEDLWMTSIDAERLSVSTRNC